MKLYLATEHILGGVLHFLEKLDDERYKQPLDIFSQATIGQHTRHVIEFFQCLLAQSKSGIVNYDKRLHSRQIEENTLVAMTAVREILNLLKEANPRQPLELEVAYDLKTDHFIKIATTFEREWVYNIEHGIHHIAMIKIGLIHIAPEISLPPDFGVAPSTIKYRNRLCVQ